MEKIIQKKGESRKKYLVRVAIAMLEENGMSIEPVHYDGTECDAHCLADDLRIEFGLPDKEDEEEEEEDEDEVVTKRKTKKKK